jgi:hypothetical protein
VLGKKNLDALFLTIIQKLRRFYIWICRLDAILKKHRIFFYATPIQYFKTIQWQLRKKIAVSGQSVRGTVCCKSDAAGSLLRSSILPIAYFPAGNLFNGQLLKYPPAMYWPFRYQFICTE